MDRAESLGMMFRDPSIDGGPGDEEVVEIVEIDNADVPDHDEDPPSSLDYEAMHDDAC
jgi:hypothetical protein